MYHQIVGTSIGFFKTEKNWEKNSHCDLNIARIYFTLITQDD